MCEAESRQMVLRNLDLIMYVLYSEDEVFIMQMVRKVAAEIADKYKLEELRLVIRHEDKPLLYRCLFFMLLNFHKEFRFWVLTDRSMGLKPVCPYKATRFLLNLKQDLLPPFFIDERMQLADVERRIKVAYLAS